MIELTTTWKEEGRQQGRQEGRQEERLDLVLRLLRRRCGALPPKVESKLRGLRIAELEQLVEVLLDFSGLVDLERWLQARPS